jgi:hypothetical protein
LNFDERFLIDRIHGGGSGAGQITPQSGVRAGADPETSQFRALLERLESLARPQETGTGPGAGAKGADAVASLGDTAGPDGASLGAADSGGSDDGLDSLQRDLRRADDEFVAAMELRRQLEQAYRRFAP